MSRRDTGALRSRHPLQLARSRAAGRWEISGIAREGVKHRLVILHGVLVLRLRLRLQLRLRRRRLRLRLLRSHQLLLLGHGLYVLVLHLRLLLHVLVLHLRLLLHVLHLRLLLHVPNLGHSNQSEHPVAQVKTSGRRETLTCCGTGGGVGLR
jgi:hypothetical protein